jgi:hypothetical protein
MTENENLIVGSAEPFTLADSALELVLLASSRAASWDGLEEDV